MLLRTILRILHMKYEWFLNKQEAAVNPLLMVWGLQGVALKLFTHFSNEIFMVSEASGRWCESIIDGLEYRGGCFETICLLLQ